MPTNPESQIPESPTPEEFAAHAKVMRHFDYVKRLGCKHTEGYTFGDAMEGPTCATCGEPMIFKSVVQVRNALMTAFKIGRAWDVQGGDPDTNPYATADPRDL